LPAKRTESLRPESSVTEAGELIVCPDLSPPRDRIGPRLLDLPLGSSPGHLQENFQRDAELNAVSSSMSVLRMTPAA